MSLSLASRLPSPLSRGSAAKGSSGFPSTSVSSGSGKTRHRPPPVDKRYGRRDQSFEVLNFLAHPLRIHGIGRADNDEVIAVIESFEEVVAEVLAGGEFFSVSEDLTDSFIETSLFG